MATKYIESATTLKLPTMNKKRKILPPLKLPAAQTRSKGRKVKSRKFNVRKIVLSILRTNLTKDRNTTGDPHQSAFDLARRLILPACDENLRFQNMG